MRKVTVVKNSEVEVKPFIIGDFMSKKENDTMSKEIDRNIKVSKKEIKALVKELDVSADESQIDFAKKILNAYMKKNK